MVDKIGQELKPGVWIVYGHTVYQSRACLRIGYVLSVVLGPETSCPWNRKDSITVWGFNDDHSEYYEHNPKDEWAKPKPLTKPSILRYSNRTLVIPKESVPEDYKKKLKEILGGRS